MPIEPSAKLQVKEQALAGLAAAVAAGCRPCARRFLASARSAGACERGIRLALETGLEVRSSATREMGDFAGALQERIPELDQAFRADKARLVQVLASGAALAVHSTDELQRHVASARELGATLAELGAAMAIARAVESAARDEVDKALRLAGIAPTSRPSGNAACGCAGA